ncbi:uncharacterized protein LOC116348953 [Contarinia nasturtii]|uniref:uncharacterized protein LOC116348953 n=1 Tax=Contarinia nasturtii TaxID=265458 RepID=UPI0012D474FB|nr:uncharacterized protein LOC116348953 [Contarinia nasturtii]
MVFIGMAPIPPSIPIIDLQVRFALKFLSSAKKLPTKAEMLKDVRNQNERKLSIEDWREYVKQLSELAGIEPVSDVLLKIVQEDIAAIARNPNDYRKYRYIIIDDKRFRKEKYIT